MTIRRHVFATLLMLLLATLPGRSQIYAQDDGSDNTREPKDQDISVAILDFEAKDPSNPDLGKQVADALSAILTGEVGFRLVDRSTLQKTLQEQELNLSGIVSTKEAIQVGQLVGAKILIVGKAFPLGKRMFITAKLIGTETSLVEGALVKSPLGADLGEMVFELAEKVATRLRESGNGLTAGAIDTADPVPGLVKQLASRKKPVVAVVIPENHIAERSSAQMDPAAETEIKKLLQDAGFEIKDVKGNTLADWAKSFDPAKTSPWPRGLNDVDVVVIGEGFSEFLTRIGNLVSCAARVEMNMIDRSTGKILLVDRTDTRAVDLAENIAGKKALQAAGRKVGIQILRHFVQALPEAKRDEARSE